MFAEKGFVSVSTFGVTYEDVGSFTSGNNNGTETTTVQWAFVLDVTGSGSYIYDAAGSEADSAVSGERTTNESMSWTLHEIGNNSGTFTNVGNYNYSGTGTNPDCSTTGAYTQTAAAAPPPNTKPKSVNPPPCRVTTTTSV